MAKSADVSTNMDKGSNGKEKDQAEKAGSKVAPGIQPNQTANVSINSKLNRSQDLICEWCKGVNEAGTWFVQCDDCDKFFHFACVGITTIGEDDPWSCQVCEVHQMSSTNQKDRQSQHENQNQNIVESSGQTPSILITQDHETEVVTSTGQQKDRLITSSVQNRLSARTRSSRSRSSTADTDERRHQIELQRLEEELQLQTEIDVETLDLRLEAIKLRTEAVKQKEVRKKKFLEDKYKAINEAESSAKSKGSRTEKSSFVASWVNDQRKNTMARSVDEQHLRNIHQFDERIDAFSFDVSIPVDERELANVRSLGQTHKSVANKTGETGNKMPPPSDTKVQTENHKSVADQVKQFNLWMSNNYVDRKEGANKTQSLQPQAREFIPHPQASKGSLNPERYQFTLENPLTVGENHQKLNSPDRSNKVEYWTIPSYQDLRITRDKVVFAPKIGAVSDTQKPPISRSTMLITQSSKPVSSLPAKSTCVSTTVSSPINLDESCANTGRHNMGYQGQYEKAIYPSQTEYSNQWIFASQAERSSQQMFTSQPEISCQSSFSSPPMVVNQPTFSSLSTFVPQPIFTTRTITSSQPIISNQPIMSTVVNSGNARSYYEQVYSYGDPLVEQPTITSAVQSTANGNCYVPSSVFGNSGRGDSVYDQLNPYQNTPNSQQPVRSYMQTNYHVPNSMVNNSRFSSSTGTQRPALTSSQIAARHAIPKDLPTFTGNPKEWSRFILRFINSTNMCGYGDDENLERLDKSLQGKARKIVESLLLLPDSVPEILETLCEKYGRPEIVIKTILAEIREVQVIKQDKLEDLSDFGYKVRNACNHIERMKLQHYLYNPELIQEIIDKLPVLTKLDWARYVGHIPLVTLRVLADWMHDLSRTINRIMTAEANVGSSDQKVSSTNKSERKDTENKEEDVWFKNAKSGFVHLHENRNSQESSRKSSNCVICAKECKSGEMCAKFKGLDVNQRWSILREKHMCRTCLKVHRQQCRVSKTCGVNGCEFRHHSLLHNEERYSKSSHATNNGAVKNSGLTGKSSEKLVTGSSNTHHLATGELYRIVPVKLFVNDKNVSTYAYLDEGSSFTLMERNIADQLGVSGTPETICLLWTNNVHRQEESEVVNLEISGRYTENDEEPATRYPLKHVNVVQDLSLPEQSLPLDKFRQRYKHLRNIPMAGYENIVPSMLIGIKHARLAVPLETVEGEGEEDQPIATRSRLGWSVYGPVDSQSTGYVNVHRVLKCPCQERDDEVHNLIKDHFTVENFGVIAKSANLDSKENEKALKMMENLTVKKGNRFETGLLWKNDVQKMPESYGMAKKRLVCLENKGPKVINVINEAVQDYIRKGYVHRLSPAELTEDHKRIWYLPLFTVVNPKKPDKLRTVFDAAAKVKGVSLNSMLHNGPDLVPSIVDILRRFRENKIAITGDIKEMYHQVMVNNEDKHAQRFLWRDGEAGKEPEIYVMDVLTFGSRSSPCSAQYVKNMNASEYEKDYPRAAVAIKKNTYVDDLMDGENSVAEAVKLIQDTKFVHLQGGFEIRNFKSNSEEVLKAIGEQISNERILVDDGANIERVLGMFWDTKSDSFTFSLKYTKVTSEVLAGKKLPTKRELLKLLMSIFDPLGLLSYYLVHVKILLQHVWRSKIGWDDVLPEHLEPMWTQWIKILPNVENLKIPRWYFPQKSEKDEEIELHVFVDASEDAYAAVAYLRFSSNSDYACSLVGSKARVAPLKYLSIPRKELMAGLLGTRLSNSIREGLSSHIHRRVIWSDSSTVLIWLQSKHQKYSQFVAHRVGEILETSEVAEWRYVPSKLNVADEATKWAKTPTFVHTDRWFAGPEFLQKSESEWPRQPKSIVPNGTTEEMKLSCSHSRLIMPSIVNTANFSKWERAVRAVAFAIRWGKKLLARVRKETTHRGPLVKEELLQAETLLFRQAQWQSFTEEMVVLTKYQKHPEKQYEMSKTSPIYDCSPYLDENGVLRVQGRLDNAVVLTMDARRPIIMPRDHHLTRLLMLSYHRKFMHKNHETAINELRQRFYVPRMRVAFRSARWNCKLCEIKRSRPRAPKMADLPAIRFEHGIRPFTYTGVDYFGPITVMVGRRTEKRWGVLFTCLTIRAVHIEIASSLDTGTCIKVIRNFINFRGRPKEFYSDNGTNFVGANNELTKELEKLNVYEISTAITSCYTRWNFNPPASPHMGGCWERLISTVKSCLYESMITRTPKDDDLRCWLMEAMNIVNSRPLTFIPLDTSEAEALTPNHFILGTSNGLKPPGKFTNDGPYLRDSWKEIQRCADIFWKRFITEYVPTLTRRTKWFENVKPLEVGDIVIDFDENNHRNTYRKARVVETIVGSKEQVRRAKVQFADGKVLWRPATRLAVLDVMHQEPTDNTSEVERTSQAPTRIVSLESSSDDRNWGENVGARNLNDRSTDDQPNKTINQSGN